MGRRDSTLPSAGTYNGAVRDIFLSYRRADTSGHAGRLTDLLEARFGRGSVFRDVESIDGGTDFVHAIDKALAGARVMLVLIGNTWSSETAPDGTRRLDNVGDFVRQEVATALAQGLPVVPVLVEGVQMPEEDLLPGDLKPLSRLQAVEVSEGRWDYDTGRLIETIARLTGLQPRGRRGPDKRRVLWVGLATLLVAAVTAGAWYAMRPAPGSPLEGVWNLPTGSFWTVWKDGAGYRVEETHYESKQVWRRGTGEATGANGFVVDLVPVFEPPGRFRFRYELKLAANGTVLAGTIRETVSGREASITLVRK
jgi:hypothetical protein